MIKNQSKINKTNKILVTELKAKEKSFKRNAYLTFYIPPEVPAPRQKNNKVTNSLAD